jgi:hydrogenase maturation protease
MNSKRILVLGIGNILWADEGFGVRCVEALNAGWEFPPQVELMDGGTQGLYLLPYVQEADCLLVFDAVDYSDPPGSLREVVGDQVPRFMGVKKMSLHQTGFQEVLMAAELTGKLPSELVLIGVQPEELEDYGGSLRDVVKAQPADSRTARRAGLPPARHRHPAARRQRHHRLPLGQRHDDLSRSRRRLEARYRSRLATARRRNPGDPGSPQRGAHLPARRGWNSKRRPRSWPKR